MAGFWLRVCAGGRGGWMRGRGVTALGVLVVSGCCRDAGRGPGSGRPGCSVGEFAAALAGAGLLKTGGQVPDLPGLPGSGCQGEDFLHRHQGRAFGAPRLRPEPATQASASNRGESRAAGGPVLSGKGRRGLAVAGAAAFAAPFGRKPYGATSCRARLPRHRPQPGPAVTPRCRATRAGPGRHARAECAGHPKILSNRFEERISGTHP